MPPTSWPCGPTVASASTQCTNSRREGFTRDGASGSHITRVNSPLSAGTLAASLVPHPALFFDSRAEMSSDTFGRTATAVGVRMLPSCTTAGENSP